MPRKKIPLNPVTQHRVGLTIQFEPHGRGDVDALLRRIKRSQPSAEYEQEPRETSGGAAHHTCTARLNCTDANALIKQLKTRLTAETGIKRVLLRIRYGGGPSAPESLVNLVS